MGNLLASIIVSPFILAVRRKKLRYQVPPRLNKNRWSLYTLPFLEISQKNIRAAKHSGDIQFSLVNLSGRIPHLSSSLRGHPRGFSDVFAQERWRLAFGRARFVPRCVNLTAFRPCLLATIQ